MSYMDFTYILGYLKNHTIIMNVVQSIIVLLGVWVALLVLGKLAKKLKDINPDKNGFEDIIPFIANVGKLGLYLLGLYILLKIWGLDVTPLLASAGVAGVAIGFAAKDSVANLFGGISIFLDKPFKVGDYVLVEGTQRGKVYKIGARSTKILTLDDVLVTIPNSVLVTNAIYNETGYDPKIKIRIELGVAYGSDLEKVEEVLLEVMKSEKDVLDFPEPLVLFTKFGASSVDLLIVGTVESPAVKVKVAHKVIKQIYKRLREENIGIPFPQTDVHLYKHD